MDDELGAGVVSSTIRFTIGGSITLSTSGQSLKVSGKNLVVDASDVGGVTIKGQNSLVFYVYGGTATNPVNLSLYDLTLTGGKTTSSRGSGVHLASDCNLATYRCSFVGNLSTVASGAGVNAKSGSLRFVDTVFSNNGDSEDNSASKGGAVFLEDGDLFAINTSFIGNNSGEGGAVYVKKGAASFENCLFQANTASSGNGGAISTNMPVALDNVSFSSNESAERGGALYINGEGESLLTDVAFYSKRASKGGALFQEGQAASIAFSVFVGNSNENLRFIFLSGYVHTYSREGNKHCSCHCDRSFHKTDSFKI